MKFRMGVIYPLGRKHPLTYVADEGYERDLKLSEELSLLERGLQAAEIYRDRLKMELKGKPRPWRVEDDINLDGIEAKPKTLPDVEADIERIRGEISRLEGMLSDGRRTGKRSLAGQARLIIDVEARDVYEAHRLAVTEAQKERAAAR